MGVKKLGEGKYILYLEECPKCGANRNLNKEKLWGTGGMTAAGVLLTGIFGLPVIGLFGGIGLASLGLGGVISIGAAAKLIQMNYMALKSLNGQKLYQCPTCGCTNLIHSANPIQKIETLNGLIEQYDNKYLELKSKLDNLSFWDSQGRKYVKRHLQPISIFQKEVYPNAKKAIKNKNEKRIDYFIELFNTKKKSLLEIPDYVKISSKKITKRGISRLVFILLIICGISFVFIKFVIIPNDIFNQSDKAIESMSDNELITIMNSFYNYTRIADLQSLNLVYSDTLRRFHSLYTIDKSIALNDSKKYLSRYRIIQQTIKPNSIIIVRNNKEYRLQYTLDYNIIRKRDGKYLSFMLLVNVIINSDGKIVSIYDEIMN